MSGLNALKLVQTKREKGSSPQHARRQKLSTKLAEQIQLAKAQQSGTEFSPVRVRTVKDEATGQRTQQPYKSRGGLEQWTTRSRDTAACWDYSMQRYG